MGTPIPPIIDPDPVAPGDQCPICWGSGKEFGDVDTPVQLVISISGINKTASWVPSMGEPVNGVFTITQVIALACQWVNNVGGINIEYRYDAFNTFLSVVNSSGFFCFLHGSSAACVLELVNELSSGFAGGSAVITLPDTL